MDTQRVERGAGVGVRFEASAAFSADAAPVADQQGAAEQVGPDVQPVVAELVALGADADQRGAVREQRIRAPTAALRW